MDYGNLSPKNPPKEKSKSQDKLGKEVTNSYGSSRGAYIPGQLTQKQKTQIVSCGLDVDALGQSVIDEVDTISMSELATLAGESSRTDVQEFWLLEWTTAFTSDLSVQFEGFTHLADQILIPQERWCENALYVECFSSIVEEDKFPSLRGRMKTCRSNWPEAFVFNDEWKDVDLYSPPSEGHGPNSRVRYVRLIAYFEHQYQSGKLSESLRDIGNQPEQLLPNMAGYVIGISESGATSRELACAAILDFHQNVSPMPLLVRAGS